LDSRTRVLISSVRKLMRRGAFKNIEKIVCRAHTADVASLLESLDSEERQQTFKLVGPAERRSEVLSYLPEDLQEEVLRTLPKEEIQTLVAGMDTDDVADLIGSLPEELSQSILKSLVKEDQEEVADLLRYSQDSAGGIMNTEVLALRDDLSVSDAIQSIQNHESDSLVAHYIYLINKNSNLVGVLSLKELLLSRPNRKLTEVMSPDVIRVRVDTPAKEVAQIVEKYDFLSVPVIDENNELAGVITVDDVIDIIREEAQDDLRALGQVASIEDDFSFWGQLASRLPSQSLIFVGGMLSFLVAYWLLSLMDRPLWLASLGFLPALLGLAQLTASQSAAVALSMIREGELHRRVISEHLLTETGISSLNGLTLALLLGGASWLAFGDLQVSQILAGIAIVQTITIALIGNLLPILLATLKVNPRVGTISLLSVVSGVTSVTLFIGAIRLYYGVAFV